MTMQECRKAKGMTQGALAAQVGVSRVTIARYESKVFRPSPDIAARIANILGLTIEQTWDMFYAEPHRETG